MTRFKRIPERLRALLSAPRDRFRPAHASSTTTSTGRRPKTLAAALPLLLACSVLVVTSVAHPRGTFAASNVTLVNAGENFITRQSDGGFGATPIFSTKLDFLAFGVQNPDNGQWMGEVNFNQSTPQQVSGGWEYTVGLVANPNGQSLDPNQGYTLVLYAGLNSQETTFTAPIPVYVPTSLWDRVLHAFNPTTWARDFAEWGVEGAHGVLCSVVQKASDSSLSNCAS